MPVRCNFIKPCRFIREVKGKGQTLQHGNNHPLICNSCTWAPALPERFLKTAIPHRTAKKISWPQKLLELVLQGVVFGKTFYLLLVNLQQETRHVALAAAIFSVWQQQHVWQHGGGCGLSVGCKNLSWGSGTTKAQQLNWGSCRFLCTHYNSSAHYPLSRTRVCWSGYFLLSSLVFCWGIHLPKSWQPELSKTISYTAIGEENTCLGMFVLVLSRNSSVYWQAFVLMIVWQTVG